MITAAQLRAARGLLNWTRSELAKASGLSAETIKNIEHGIYTPQETTITAIVHAFEEHEVQFTDDEGVRVRKNHIKVFSGESGYKDFLDHIFDTLKMSGGKIRQFNLNDDQSLPYAKGYEKDHLIRMSKIKNLDAKVLTVDESQSRPALYCKYRFMNKEQGALVPYYIYNNYIAMPLYKTNHKVEVVSICSDLLSEMYSDQFDKLWEQYAS